MKPISIRKRLLLSLISLIGLTWLGITLLVNEDATHELEEIYDASLAQNARILFGLLQQEIKEGEIELFRNIELSNDFLHEYELNIAFSAALGKRIIHSRDAPEFLTELPEGFSDYTFNGDPWRVFTLHDRENNLVIHTAQKLLAREELVAYLVKDTLLVMMMILPLLGAFIWLGVNRSLWPLNRLVTEAGAMDPDSLRPFNIDDAPAEISPLIMALNRLLGRLEQTLVKERRFTADAAHELRTPLAGLRVQLQVAMRATNEQQRHEAMNKALQGVDRSTHLVNQLLTLARADRENARTLTFRSVDLVQQANEVADSLQKEARQNRIRLSVESGQPQYSIEGEPTMLQVLLRNLLENAIKYAPGPGAAGIRISSEPGCRVRLVVWDTGPGFTGVSPKLMFQRFRRGEQSAIPGSGLGLSIVKRIAEIHEAEIDIEPATAAQPFAVAVTFKSLPEQGEPIQGQTIRSDRAWSLP